MGEMNESNQNTTLEEILAGHAKEREERIRKVVSQKEAIVTKAKEILAAGEFKSGKEQLNRLFDEWKQLEQFRTEDENRLWESLCKSRDAFREKMNSFFEDQAVSRENSKKRKQELVEETKAIVISDEVNWKQISDQLKQMMEEWKALGFAGKDDNDKLWDEFNSARKIIFEKRDAAFEEINAKRQKAAEVKKELIAEAKKIADTKDYSKENTDAMKALDLRWKQAGSAGKEREDELWTQFSEAKEVFWAEKQAIADAKHEEWANKRKAILASKKKQMSDLYGQIDSLKKSIYNSLDIPKITRVSGWIAEKQEIIAGLKKEIKEIEDSLKK